MRYDNFEETGDGSIDVISVAETFLGTALLVAMVIYLGGCTFCLRYVKATLTSTDPIGPLHQAKKACLQRQKINAENAESKDSRCSASDPKKELQMTIIKIDDSDPSTETNEGHYLTSDDLRRFSLTPQVGDWKYYSDCQSISSMSDFTLSPGGSPFVSPPGTPTGSLKRSDRSNSSLTMAFQPRIGKIQEGQPLAGPRRNSAQVAGENIKKSEGKRRKHYGTLERSLSVPVLPVCHFNPEIEFNIRYDYRRYSLIVECFKVKDLNLSSICNGNVFIKSDLLPTDKTRYTEKQPPSSNPAFSRVLFYEDLNESDIHKSSLLLTIFFSDPINLKKGTPIGEALVKVSELEVCGKNKFVKKPLQKKRLRKKSTSSTSLFRELGDLFILLQYNSSANRIKVLVRKATHLPTGGKLPGQPDHFVLIDLLKKGSKVTSKETKSQRGCNPTWNEPFLFDIEGGNIEEYSIEFTIFRGRIYTKDNVLGHVIIGPNGTRVGRSHWQETASPHGLEIAKWHTILPVFKY